MQGKLSFDSAESLLYLRNYTCIFIFLNTCAREREAAFIWLFILGNCWPRCRLYMNATFVLFNTLRPSYFISAWNISRKKRAMQLINHMSELFFFFLPSQLTKPLTCSQWSHWLWMFSLFKCCWEQTKKKKKKIPKPTLFDNKRLPPVQVPALFLSTSMRTEMH